MFKITRRQFLKIMGLSSAATVVGYNDLVLAQNSEQEIYKSENGLLTLNLRASETTFRLDGQDAKLFCYNETLPGPRLEVRAGDTIRIHFVNNLPQSTNLHFHGLHVSPEGNSDNVFLEIASGESFDYELKLPENHPSGTFWYHPHYHGHVAEQVSKGLTGLIIVRGKLDDLPEVAAAQEHFLVLKDLDLDRRGNVSGPGMMDRVHGREGDLITVSGEYNPSIHVAKNGLARLRVLNASPSKIYKLRIEDHSLHLIATDGGAIAETKEISELILAPGERAEVLVKADKEGSSYRLINEPYSRYSGMMGGESQRSAETIATLIYDGEELVNTELPTKLSEVALLTTPPVRTRYFDLYHRGMMGRGPSFFIDLLNDSGQKIGGGVFDHERVDITAKLGEVEDWVIQNSGSMDHPFHVHVNSFQVLDDLGQPEAAWRDIVLVKAGESKTIRMRFEDYTGKAIYHCHILDHEDLGMMGVIEFT